MNTLITEGVSVSVQTSYFSPNSRPYAKEYAFGYRITIENKSPYTIQILRRHWFVIDAHCVKKEVEGEGVIGQQPIIEPKQTYQYSSGCILNTPIGKMYGSYLVERVVDGKLLRVQIPEFVLCVPYLFN